jgi:hypothetical protein
MASNVVINAVFAFAFLNCHAATPKDEINIKEFPRYFSTETWEAIEAANVLYDKTAKKIVAIMDSPVKYIAGLDDKNDNDIQDLIDNAANKSYSYIDHPYHGTAVASLIVSKPYKLPCSFITEKNFSSKPCDKKEIVVVGMAQHTNIINSLAANADGVAEAIKNLVTKLEPISAEEKRAAETTREQIPVKAILNFSFGPQKDKRSIKSDYLRYLMTENKKRQSGAEKNSDDYLLLQWIIEYVDNNMQWLMPPSPALILNIKWHNMQPQRDAIQRDIEQELKKQYDILEKYKDAIERYILPNKASFLVIVAAGNDKKQLYGGNAGFLLGKTTMEDDPILGVAAGCGKEYRELCSFSNYGKKFVDILAPGEHIPVLLVLESGRGLFVSKTTYVSGTSFSAPLVAGTAALLAQCDPTASTADIKKVILESAKTDRDLEARVAEGRILDVKKAVETMCKTDVATYSTKQMKIESLDEEHDEF